METKTHYEKFLKIFYFNIMDLLFFSYFCKKYNCNRMKGFQKKSVSYRLTYKLKDLPTDKEKRRS